MNRFGPPRKHPILRSRPKPTRQNATCAETPGLRDERFRELDRLIEEQDRNARRAGRDPESNTEANA